ncbi:MAG: tRNA (adenosine(37)-N6)-dimethylallyltransferase MiaA [Patescibacteria group bacterium]
MNPKLIVILGPTATGKSALAVSIAKKNHGEIISADSRQVYTGLNIGTGKITKKEMDGVPHHLIDVVTPDTRFSVEEFGKLAREKISEIFSRGNLPILCGGTGFYIEAITENISLPRVSPNEVLREKLKTETAETLFAQLLKLDPARAKSIDPKNSRRIIRAIEIATAIGKVPPLNLNRSDTKVEPLYETLKIGLTLPPEKLRKKITIRLFARMDEGMIGEAKSLHQQGISWERMDELGLEYRYLAKYLKGDMTEPEMLKKLETEIWRYAKRQMTWFKRDKSIQWFKPNDERKIESVVKNFLINK